MSNPSEQDPTASGPHQDRPEPRYGQYASSDWQAPSGPNTPPPAAPGWGAAPGWDPNQPLGYGQQVGSAPTGRPGQPFTPMSAQPGIVPLRPLTVWEIIDGAFRAIRHNPKVMFGVTVVGVTISVLISAVIGWYVSASADGLIDDLVANLGTSDTADLKAALGTLIGSMFALPVSLVFTQIITGVLIRSVSQSVLGKVATPREVLHGQGTRLAQLVGFAVLSLLAELAMVAALFALVFLVLKVNVVLGAVLSLLGGMLVIVAAFWFSVRTLLVPAALMLEGGRFWTTVARGWRLTRGSFWRLTGLSLLVTIATGLVSQIVAVPFTVLMAIIGVSTSGTGIATVAISSVGEVIATTLTTVFAAGAYALAYIDARIRTEGLDVELAAAAAQV